jgi:hypothetical protein
MNRDELKVQGTKSVWTSMNFLERLSSRWHAGDPEFDTRRSTSGLLKVG